MRKISLVKIEQLTRDLLKEYGYSKWNTVPIRFSTSMTRRLGHVKFNKNENKVVEIAFQKEYCTYGKVEYVVDTVKHEVAHVLDIMERGYSNHDDNWKRLAVKVGAKPDRVKTDYLWQEDYTTKQMKYTLTCEHCGKVSHKSRMHQGSQFSCGACNPKEYDERYLLKVVQNY